MIGLRGEGQWCPGHRRTDDSTALGCGRQHPGSVADGGSWGGGLGEWSLARPWPPGPGRCGVDSIRLIITGTARRKSGMEEDDGLEVAALVVAVEVVVVVVFMMKLMLGIRITEWTGVRGITAQIRQREACLSLRTTLYCHDPTPRNPTRHHTEAWRIPIEPPVLTVPTHTGSLLTKSCGCERFLTSGLWLPVQVARPL